MTQKTGIALVCIVIVSFALFGIWFGNYTTSGGGSPPETRQPKNLITLWNQTSFPTGGVTQLTASFTLPTAASSAILHVEWSFSFIHHYSADRVGIQTSLYLDSLTLDHTIYASELNYAYEEPISFSGSSHTVKLVLVVMVLGPAYSTFSEIATGWVSYKT